MGLLTLLGRDKRSMTDAKKCFNFHSDVVSLRFRPFFAENVSFYEEFLSYYGFILNKCYRFHGFGKKVCCAGRYFKQWEYKTIQKMSMKRMRKRTYPDSCDHFIPFSLTFSCCTYHKFSKQN